MIVTPDDTRRFAVLEMKVEYLEQQAERHEKRMVTSMDKLESKLDTLTGAVQRLLDASNMGRGAWWAMVKVGAVLIAIITIVVALYDRLRAVLQ
jgi:hypothetical protein